MKDAQADLYQQAFDLYADQKYEDAQNHFLLLTLLEPSQAHYWYGLGCSAFLRADWSCALKAFAVTTLVDPSNPYPHFYAAQCLLKKGEAADSQKAFTKAKELSLRFPQEHLSLLRQIAKTQGATHA